jgi:hypothetical protein
MFVILNCPLISCLILTIMMFYVDDVYFTRNHGIQLCFQLGSGIICMGFQFEYHLVVIGFLQGDM